MTLYVLVMAIISFDSKPPPTIPEFHAFLLKEKCEEKLKFLSASGGIVIIDHKLYRTTAECKETRITK